MDPGSGRHGLPRHFPGTVLLYYFAGGVNEAAVYALMVISCAALILSLVAARAADQEIGQHVGC